MSESKKVHHEDVSSMTVILITKISSGYKGINLHEIKKSIN